MQRKFNFGAGPSNLPLSVLEEAAKELVDYKDNGLSIMESSHRAKLYDVVHQEAISLVKEMLDIPENYKVLFLQGGASLQFAMVPMNIAEGKKPLFANTGTWTKKAIGEMKVLGKECDVITSSEDAKFNYIPKLPEFTEEFVKDAPYFHIASNNTIFGTQYKELPETNGLPLVIDASSDIFSRPVDWKNIGILFAGAQKNAGPSGVTIVVIREDLIGKADANTPSLMNYSTQAKEDSLYNTPPTFGIYMLSLVMKWLKDLGGVKAIQKINEDKAALLYAAIDNSDGFYTGHAEKSSRSLMNVTFNLKTPELEAEFIKAASEKGLMALKGHRSIGGIRASIYNAMPVEGVKALVEFMKNFKKEN